MKRCFTFSTYQECKPVARFLQEILPTPVHIQLGNSIAVGSDNYQTAILEGKKYVIQNNISCNWVDFTDNEINMALVPIAFITLNAHSAMAPHSVSSEVLTHIMHFTDLVEKVTTQASFFQVRADGTIAILVNTPTSTHVHYEIVRKMKEQFRTFDSNAFRHVAFTDIFGKIV